MNNNNTNIITSTRTQLRSNLQHTITTPTHHQQPHHTTPHTISTAAYNIWDHLIYMRSALYTFFHQRTTHCIKMVALTIKKNNNKIFIPINITLILYRINRIRNNGKLEKMLKRMIAQ